jgi:quinol monooxygenase YgiN
MVVITGSVMVKADRLAEAVALSLEHVRRSRLENGCVSHAVYVDAENPNRLFFFEEWADRAAVDAHFAVPASREFVRGLGRCAAERPRLSLYDATRRAV